MARLVNTCWAFFRGGLTLVVLLAIALGGFLYFRLDDEAKRLSEAALNRYCAPFVARVGSASFTPGRGVTMRDIELVEPVPWQAPRGVLQIDELLVEGNFNIGVLIQGKPIVTRVVAKSPRLAATRRRDGTWNVADLKPPPKAGGPPPRIELRDATIVLAREAAAGDHLAIHHLDATVAPDASHPDAFAVSVKARDTVAQRLEARGTVSADGRDLDLDYRVEGLAISPERFGSLARFGFVRLPAAPVTGVISAGGKAKRVGDGSIDWDASFTLTSGEYRVAGVKRPLSEITLSGQASPAGLRIDRGDARWGDASIVLAGRRSGWSLFSPLALRARVKDFDLASTPVDRLPDQVATVWNRFRPRGLANVEFDLTFDGARFVPRATIEARNASFEDAEKFPYRLVDGGGTLRVNGGVSDSPTPAAVGPGTRLDLDLHGMADDAPVRITGSFEKIGARRYPPGKRPLMPLGWVEVSGNGVPVSDRLIDAIPDDEPRTFVHSLNPAGRVDVSWRAERTDIDERMPTIGMRMRLADCRLLYDRFPYPLSGVTGWIEQKGKDWRFYELRSRDTQGRTVVEGYGSLQPKGNSCGFELTLRGDATPLDQTLYDALPADTQQAWAFVRPRGQIDFTAKVTRRCGEPEPRVYLTMNPHRQNLAIEPPLSESGHRYRLENIDGEFQWADKRLTIRNARGRHARTTYLTDGAFESLDGGGWKLDLQALRADRLEFNREFLLAAPAGLRTTIEDLQPRGGLDLFDGRLEVSQKLGAAGPVEARWKVSLSCHQVAINAGVPLDGISGVVRLGGSSDGAAGFVGGEVDLDSVFWNDFQLTDVRGPLWADDSDAFLGVGVADRLQAGEKRPIEKRPITAKAYGGDISLNSWVRHGVQPRYGLAIGMGAIDVTRLAAEWLERPEAIHGTLDGTLQLQGVGTSVYGMTGNGAMNVSDADLYELPFFLSLLKYLRNRTPDNTAFNRLETKFTLEGNDLRFENFDLLGDAVSLYGKGSATLQREVDLTFASIVGRNEFAVPVLKAFMSSASEQLLRLRVVGPIDSPEIRRELLPAVGNVFEQLQAEFGGRVTNNAARPGGATRR